MGVQADEFIQALSGRQKDALKKFITHEKPEEDECYVWVREDPTLKVFFSFVYPNQTKSII
jgi:hypothetical protein